jgi:hypothetical protein
LREVLLVLVAVVKALDQLSKLSSAHDESTKLPNMQFVRPNLSFLVKTPSTLTPSPHPATLPINKMRLRNCIKSANLQTHRVKILPSALFPLIFLSKIGKSSDENEN